MARKRYKPEEIVAKLRQVDVLVSQGQNMVDAIRQIGVSEVTYYRWRQEFGGLKIEQVKRLKDLELENSRLRKAVLDDPAQSLRAREGWFDSVAFLISFSPGIPFPGSQIKSKSCGSFFSDELDFILGKHLERQNEQPKADWPGRNDESVRRLLENYRNETALIICSWCCRAWRRDPERWRELHPGLCGVSG